MSIPERTLPLFYEIVSTEFEAHSEVALLGIVTDSSYKPVTSWCKHCGRPLASIERQPELVFEQWSEKDVTKGFQLGDVYFISTHGVLLVSSRVRSFVLDSQINGISFITVRMKSRKMHRVNKKLIDPLPLKITQHAEVQSNEHKMYEACVSGVATVDYSLNGVELSEHVKCVKCNHVVVLGLRRPPNAPWRIRRNDWDGSGVFRIVRPIPQHNELPQRVYVTESVRDCITNQGFTNIRFDAAGWIE